MRAKVAICLIESVSHGLGEGPGWLGQIDDFDRAVAATVPRPVLVEMIEVACRFDGGEDTALGHRRSHFAFAIEVRVHAVFDDPTQGHDARHIPAPICSARAATLRGARTK